MEHLNALFLRVISISAGCTAVLIPLLLMMPRVQKRIAAGSFYVLFLLLAVQLAVPAPLPQLKAAVTAEAPEADGLVLRHELIHIRCWDVAYKIALSLACAVHWFNPIVWWMDRAAGRNLELCCDNEAVRGLSREVRRRYGGALLDAAEAVQPMPFSTCFAGGKQQLKDRLDNLFAAKKNSVSLVCVILLAALLAGSLVACENAQNNNNARRTLFEEYFYENYTADNATVVLADLTGDGLEEMLVMTMDSVASLREPVSPEDFSYASIAFHMIKDGKVTLFGGTCDVSSSHAGWGRVYLIPWTDSQSYALLDFRTYIGQGYANYSCNICILGENSTFISLEQRDVSFQLDSSSLMGSDTGEDASAEEVEELLSRVWELRGDGVLLLDYQDYERLSSDYTDPRPEFAYLNVPPEEAFRTGTALDAAGWLKAHIVENGVVIGHPVPLPDPASPEEALDYLEHTLKWYIDGSVFRVPRYDGTWDIQITGQVPRGGPFHVGPLSGRRGVDARTPLQL